MTHPADDGRLEELLGAYALNSCDPDEAAAVEALLDRRPDLADEAARLADASAWLAALEARGTALDAARRRPRHRHHLGRRPGRRRRARLYDAEVRRLALELDRVDPDHYEVTTANGLTAFALVVHIAAQETLLARSAGRPVDDVDVTDVDARTAVLVERYRGRPYAEVIQLWERAVAAVQTWAREKADRPKTVEWLGLPMEPADALTARSFENWVHRDDLRRVRGEPGDPPPAAELRLMAALAVRTLPAGLAATGHARPGRTARVVLTGDGGGSWPVALDPAGTVSDEPDVTLTVSALDWCRLAAERLDPADLPHTVEGDHALAGDLVAAAPAFATL